FDTCSPSCGPGNQYRDNYCRDNTDPSQPTVSDWYCLTYVSGEPATSQTCTNGPCYGWQYDGWDTCSVTCSSGVQYRDVWCQDTTNNVPAGPETFCTAPKQATQQSCGSPCTNNYLASFTITNQISFPFVPGTQTYSVDVPDTI